MKRSWKLISFALAITLITLLLTGGALAGEETAELQETVTGACGVSLTWSLDEAGTLTISPVGKPTEATAGNYYMEDYRYPMPEVDDDLLSGAIPSDPVEVKPTPWDGVRDRIKKAVVEDGVLIVGSYAFYDCPNLETVELSDRIRRIHPGAFLGCAALKEVRIPSAVTELETALFFRCTALESVELPAGLTSIGKAAFFECTSLDLTAIPDALTSLGAGAFAKCTALTGPLTIPAGVPGVTAGLFYECESLKNVTLHSGMTFIDTGAFYGCAALTGPLDIPAGVYDLGEAVFYGCRSLTGAITVPEGITALGRGMFCMCSSLQHVTLPESLKSIGLMAFTSCSSLEDIAIPGGVGAVPANAFEGCTGLTEATLGEGISRVGDSAFAGCALLETAELPGSLIGIGSYAFRDCAALENVRLPDKLESIGAGAFEGCVALPEAVFPDTLTALGAGAFKGCASLQEAVYPLRLGDAVPKELFRGCSGLRSITIESGVVSIGDGAFLGCSGLTGTYALPESVTVIGPRAFSGCSGVEAFILGSGVTAIGEYAFSGCSALREFAIPEGMTVIDKCVLSECTSLETLHIPESLASITDHAFNRCTGLAEIWYGGSPGGWAAFLANNDTPNKIYYLTSAFVYYAKGDAPTYSGSCGGPIDPADPLSEKYDVRYVLDAETGLLTISGEGEMMSWWGYNADLQPPWYPYRALIKSVAVEEGVTVLGAYAFYDCRLLEHVSLPESLRYMGPSYDSSGSDPASLASYAFASCPLLTTAGPAGGGHAIEFRWSTYIGFYAFSGDDCLESLTLPEGLERIQSGACRNCAALSHAVIPAGVTSIAADAFTGCPLLDSLGETGSGCALEIPWEEPCLAALLTGNGTLRRVVLPERVTEIPEGLFAGCTGITELRLPDRITAIRDRAFAGCTGLASLQLPAALTELGASAFAGCTALETLEIPGCPASVGQGAFADCTALREAYISGGGGEIREEAFRGCAALETVRLPLSVTAVGASAFAGCGALSDVYYGGSETDWSAMTIGENNDPLLNAARHCEKTEDARFRAAFLAVERTAEGYAVTAACWYAGGAVACAAQYDAQGRFLAVREYPLEEKDGNLLLIPAGKEGYLRIFALAADTYAPLCAPLGLACP